MLLCQLQCFAFVCILSAYHLFVKWRLPTQTNAADSFSISSFVSASLSCTWRFVSIVLNTGWGSRLIPARLRGPRPSVWHCRGFWLPTHNLWVCGFYLSHLDPPARPLCYGLYFCLWVFFWRPMIRYLRTHQPWHSLISGVGGLPSLDTFTTLILH